MFKSFKNLLGLVSLLAFSGAWIGCSSEASPVSPSASKALTDDGTGTDTGSDSSPVVDFTDNNLEYEVALEIFPEGSVPAQEDIGHGGITITRSQLLTLETLSAGGKGITSLVGLEYATNLKSLYLKVNDVADLTPLANLTKLEVLNLENNLIPQTGYSPLANLTKLTNLRIGGHRNGDISSDSLEAVVKNMRDLADLKVNNMGLTDISFLENLTKLASLNLNSNLGITNFKPLTCLKNLVDLRVQNIRAVYDLPTGHDRHIQAATGHDRHIQYLIDDPKIHVSVIPYFSSSSE